MKKVLAWILLVVLVLGMFAGCKRKNQDEPTVSPTDPTGAVSEGPTAEDAPRPLLTMTATASSALPACPSPLSGL